MCDLFFFYMQAWAPTYFMHSLKLTDAHSELCSTFFLPYTCAVATPDGFLEATAVLQ